jgi:hypothetical protein
MKRVLAILLGACVAPLACAVAGGCSSFSSSESADGAAESSAPGEVAHDDFENGSLACSDWSPFSSTGIIVEGGHAASAHACRLCGHAAFSTLTKQVSSQLPGHYTLDMWMRADNADAAPSQMLATLKQIVNGGQGMAFNQQGGTATADWTPFEITGQTDAGAGFTLQAELKVDNQACYLFDDVSITYAP